MKIKYSITYDCFMNVLLSVHLKLLSISLPALITSLLIMASIRLALLVPCESQAHIVGTNCKNDLEVHAADVYLF